VSNTKDLLQTLEQDVKRLQQSFDTIVDHTQADTSVVTARTLAYTTVMQESGDTVLASVTDAVMQQKALISGCARLYTQLGSLDSVHEELTLIKQALANVEHTFQLQG
jgi:hypothetical protein